MNISFNEIINFNSSVSDFVVDPLNGSIITAGDGIDIYANNEKKSVKKSKLKNSLALKFVNYRNQLFQSNDLYIYNTSGEIYIVKGKNRKIDTVLNLNNKNITNLCINSFGNIAYLENNVLNVLNTETNQFQKSFLKNEIEGTYKIYISRNILMLKFRKIHSNDITIYIFRINDLKEISRINSQTNHIYSKIIGDEYLASIEDGTIELWDIVKSEVKKVYDIGSTKITYIENDDKYYYFGNVSGELIITDKEFNIIDKKNLFKSEVKKIIIFNKKIYVLSQNNKLRISSKINDDGRIVDNFINKYNIHSSYIDFFTESRVIKILDFIDNLKANNISFTPDEDKIFRALEQGIDSLKVCLIGKDPYYQRGIATGLSFEVRSSNWNDEKINTSLKNILKLIYKSYTGKIEDINNIRMLINKKEFKILPPDRLFESWKNQGVLLLNSSLTTIINKAGAHHSFWKPIIEDLIEYISIKNKNIIFFLWGNDAKILENRIKNGNVIKHNHPAICGNLNNKNDFMLGKSFEKTKNIINWLGE